MIRCFSLSNRNTNPFRRFFPKCIDILKETLRFHVPNDICHLYQTSAVAITISYLVSNYMFDLSAILHCEYEFYHQLLLYS